MAADLASESPLVSLLTTVADPDREAFEATATSVQALAHPGWEWVVVDDGSTQEWVADRLRALVASDDRIRLVEQAHRGPAAAAGAALAAARGEFVALLDAGATVTKGAIGHLTTLVSSLPVLDFCYSDHAPITGPGSTGDPVRKAAWSPERLRHTWYTQDLAVYRRSLVEDVGGFRAEFEDALGYDLALRAGEQAREVHHLRMAICHRPPTTDLASFDAAAIRAVQDHLDRLGLAATVGPGPEPGYYRIVREPDLTTPVSVVIPTIGTRAEVWGEQRTLVTATVRELAENTRHRDVEFVVVYDTPTPAEVLAELVALRDSHGIDLTLVEFTEPFNFSAKCNVGAWHARGEVLAFLNDDMQPRSDGVIESLIAPLAEPSVGLTGAKLYFENGTIQHGGVRFGSNYRGDPYREFAGDATGDYCELLINHEVTVVTGACVAVRREAFEQIGGFTESLPMNFNDIDFSLKAHLLGWQVVWLHDVELFHFESVTRDSSIAPWEEQIIADRWGDWQVEREVYSMGIR